MRLLALVLAAALAGACSRHPFEGFFTRGTRHLAAKQYAEAVLEFQNAARVQPASADTQMKLGEAYAGLGRPAHAAAAYQRACELDPANTEACVEAAAALLGIGQYESAAAEARGILGRDRFNLDAQLILASALAGVRRFSEAEERLQAALAAAPEEARVYRALGDLQRTRGNWKAAEAALRKAIALQPQAAQNHVWLAIIQILRGQPGAAVELAKQETDPFWRTYALALAYFANGDRAEADAALKKLIDEDADESGSQIAEVYALRKEPEKMFEWLEHAWTTHDAGVTELLNDPFLRAYKDDPRFIAFAQKVGVMPKAAATP